MNKIDLMHKHFGTSHGNVCGECKHLIRIRNNRLYRKCEVYGDSSSEATDWKVSNTACGLFPDKLYDSRPVVELAAPNKKPEQQLSGQMSFENMGGIYR